MAHVIWADDDSDGLLQPLERLMELVGHKVHRSTSYDEALLEMSRLKGTRHSLLADVILPLTGGRGALSPYLGIELAREAAQAGVTRILFLTVVPRYEVEAELDRLQRDHPDVEFIHYDKATLLEPLVVENMLQDLKG